MLADRVAAAVLRAAGGGCWRAFCGVPRCSCIRCAPKHNWGIGDFGDLTQLIRWMAGYGAGFIGLNPLHALAPADPARASPYSASSRHFLNVLYICVPAVNEFDACAAARARVAEPAFAARLAAAQASELVDYPEVADLKFDVLEILYRDFCERCLAVPTERGTDFRAFVAAGGAALQAHARFDALDGFFRTTRECASGWFSWPEEYRDVNGRAAARFAAENPAKIEFYLYLQWLAHQQLRAAQALTRELGMPVGLYGDYAVGANPAGSETWADRDSFKMGAEIGAPPDPLALKGQGWGIPPQDPASMESQKLQGFRQLLRNNMQYYGRLAPRPRDVAVSTVVGAGRCTTHARGLRALPAAPVVDGARARKLARQVFGGG